MSNYEQRLAEDKGEIRKRVSAVSAEVRKAVAEAVEASVTRNRAACYRIVLGDPAINREIRSIDQRCRAFVARHLPSAGHLRFVSSVLQMNVAIERIGDYAVTIAREGAQLKSEPPASIIEDIRILAEDADDSFSNAILAFTERDVELARATRPRARIVDAAYGRAFHDLTKEGKNLPLVDSFALLMIIKRLERVSDQAKNISEETLFELTGELKPAKVYRILFADATDSMIAPLAVALARKSFPESGVYESAGIEPASSLAPELSKLAIGQVLDFSGIVPSAMPMTRNEIEAYHIVIALTPQVIDRIEEMPYSTSLLEWKPFGHGDDNVEVIDASKLERVAHYLTNEIQNLMLILRGEDAI
jgi:phosphate transport system protein